MISIELKFLRVIQMDPPSNAEAFVHRCGRTARIGNKGAAVLLLTPSEESYIDFLNINQKVKLTKMETDQCENNLVDQVRTLLKSDESFGSSKQSFCELYPELCKA